MWYREESVIKNSHLRNKSICTSLYFSGKLNTEALKLEKTQVPLGRPKVYKF